MKRRKISVENKVARGESILLSHQLLSQNKVQARGRERMFLIIEILRGRRTSKREKAEF